MSDSPQGTWTLPPSAARGRVIFSACSSPPCPSRPSGSYTDTNAAREIKGSVARRGLCGDVWLTSAPRGARIREARIETSFRRGQITFITSLEGLSHTALIRADIFDQRKLIYRFASAPL